MIAVTKSFMPLIKMTVLAHYLTFPIQLQWLIKYYLSGNKKTGKFYFACF